MNICETINNFDINNIYYLDPIKNTVIENSNFIRILYSNNLFTLNGLYLYTPLNKVNLIINNNKTKYNINIDDNFDIINFLKNLESNILNNSIIKNKKPYYKLNEQLSNGYLKIVNNSNDNSNTSKLYEEFRFILKISGIWESNIEYGLTYKILDINNVINHPL